MEEEILKSLEGKRIIFCLPGDSYSGDFLVNFYGLTSRLLSTGVNTSVANLSGSCIHRLRNQVGGGRPDYGLYQRPYSTGPDDEKYDYIMWIDSDIKFALESFTKLIALDKDICTGWYKQKDGLPACGFTDKIKDKYDQRNPPFPLYDRHNIYRHYNDKEIESKTEPYPIDWVGMGWFLVKSGVMETVKYPWFLPRTVRVGKFEDGEHLYDSLSEDISFQMALKEAGHKIWLDPTCKVGHEKVMVL